ncbi:MAG TPA: hypothetical protein VFI20_07650 [Terracidiphilus sp.]|nr:hypothetical protein [Terracidiphilus sp.]
MSLLEHQNESSVISPSKKIIYDFGANNGSDIPYYLKKANLVVAVEANPSLCETMRERFSTELLDGRLQVENCVVVGEGRASEVNFYLHKRHDVLGQFLPPDDSVMDSYTKILLPSQPVMQVLRKYGSPYYVKIDIEHI